MPLQITSLDDLDWEDLMEEARTRIPAYAPEWTDFNPSDPGITLLELFACYVETLLYRVNRTGREHRHAFLQLVNGPEWKGTGEEERDRDETLRQLRSTERAVTAEDYETIVSAALGSKVARAKCIPDRNLERGRAASSATEAPGDVSVVLLPSSLGDNDPRLLADARRVLDNVRLLGTRVHVVRPRYLRVAFRFRLVLNRNTRHSGVIDAAMDAIRSHFSPFPSPDGPGWPFGRAVYVSEVYAVLDRLEGVNYVTKAVDPATGRLTDEISVAETESRRLRRNSAGDLDAILLELDELVQVAVDEHSFVIERERAV
jgi:hypothetical protein